MNPLSNNTVQRIVTWAHTGHLRLKYIVQTSRVFTKKRTLLAVSSMTLTSLFLIFTIVSAANDPFLPTLAASNRAEETSAETGGNDASYALVSPVLVNNASTVVLLGTVISNETANIYPRRDGIVEDITVDIGDTVKKGQVVALLLPKGVEGESAAAISRKKAEKSKMETEYETAKNVAKQSLNKTHQEIDEKREELAAVLREQEGMIQRIALAAVNVEQMQDQAFVIVRSARQTIERLLFGSNARTNINAYESNILPRLGVLQRETRYDIIPFLNAMKKLEDAYANAPDATKEALMRELLAASQNTFSALHALIASTDGTPIPLPGRDITIDPTEMTEEAHEAQTMVLEAKEKWENALLMAKELRASEPELAAKLRGEIKEGRSNEAKLITAGLKTMEEELLFVASEQEQIVRIAEQGIHIADAELRMETVQSGNRQILSPFTGVVAKRFIEVGQIVMPSDPVFELTNVSTSLAKKAKAEIQFGLPENLLSAVNVGDTVQFFRQSNEEKMYEAIVTRKSPQVDAETYIIMVQARIPEDLHLPHRSSVRVRLMDEDRPVFRVPAAAVKREEEANYVWILEPDRQAPTQEAVTVIAEDGEFAEIAGAITVESKIILDSPLLFTADETASPPLQP
ncbi:MAG: HlyD family efflux transporter periplasmic adaptor subunit [Patescibacteria group bacterium]